MAQQRITAGLIPYYQAGGEIFVYLQKKDRGAPMLADQFSFFGGGLEGEETPAEALVREIEEELEYTPRDFDYLGRYENEEVVMHAYREEVAPDFASRVVVHEGEYGAFFSPAEALALPNLRDTFKAALRDFAELLASEAPRS